MKRIAKASHDVRDIEKCIVKLYEKGANDDKISDEIESLLMERWGLMHKSIVWDDEFIAKLAAMNEKMKQALIDMRNLALGTYNHQIANCPDDKEFDVTGRLFVDDMEMEGWEYGSHMSDYLSEILQTPEYSGLYRYGVAHEVITFFTTALSVTVTFKTSSTYPYFEIVITYVPAGIPLML